VPVRTLMSRLAIKDYDHPAPFRAWQPRAGTLRIRLAQHAGAPAVPGVAVGDRLDEGAVLAEPPAGAVGALLHAPMPGTVRAVTPQEVVLEVNP